MNTEQTSNSKKKDNRNIVYGVLIAALIGTWSYIIYDKNKSSNKVEQLQMQYSNADSAKNEVEQLYNASLVRLDSLTGTNKNLTDSMSGRNKEIAKLKSEIKSILNKKNATASELSRAKQLIAELNGKIEDLAAEVEKLQGENKDLTAKNEQITTEKQAVEKTLSETQTAKKQLEETVDVGSTLHASNITITPINEKGGGREKATSTAKRVDKLRISFNVDENRIATNGEKVLYVCLYSPDGKPVSIPAYGSGTFSTRDAGEKTFTNKLSINYEQGKRSSVSFDWKQDQKFQEGDYKVEVYHNGFKIGENTVRLKKGGLFS